jgi:hypothetical protein
MASHFFSKTLRIAGEFDARASIKWPKAGLEGKPSLFDHDFVNALRSNQHRGAPNNPVQGRMSGQRAEAEDADAQTIF